MQIKPRSTRVIALLTGGVIAATTLFHPAPAQAADKSKKLKYGAVGLGVVGAYLLSKGKTVPGAVAVAGGLYAYKKGRNAQENHEDNYRYPEYRSNAQYRNNGGYNNGYYGNGGYRDNDYRDNDYRSGGYRSNNGRGRNDRERNDRDCKDSDRRDNNRDRRNDRRYDDRNYGRDNRYDSRGSGYDLSPYLR